MHKGRDPQGAKLSWLGFPDCCCTSKWQVTETSTWHSGKPRPGADAIFPVTLDGPMPSFLCGRWASRCLLRASHGLTSNGSCNGCTRPPKVTMAVAYTSSASLRSQVQRASDRAGWWPWGPNPGPILETLGFAFYRLSILSKSSMRSRHTERHGRMCGMVVPTLLVCVPHESTCLWIQTMQE